MKNTGYLRYFGSCRRSAIKRLFCAALLAAVLPMLCLWGRAEEAFSVPATDYSKNCEYRFSYAAPLRDHNKANNKTFAAGSVLPISWKEDVPVRYVYIAFVHDPVPFTLNQYDENGVLLSTQPGLMMLDYAYALSEGSRSLEIVIGKKAMSLCALYMYGEGDIPDFHPFTEPKGKLDYLIVATHCDDDVLFLGAIPPIYGAERGKEGTVVYLACSSRLRMDEGQNGAWTMGIRICPRFSPFKDVQKRTNSMFRQEEVTQFIVRELRRLKPDVVIGQDPNGEYGHWQHKDGVLALQQAVILANDPLYDPDSVALYGAWQVKKLYLHLYPENTLILDINAPLNAFGGKSALEVSREAFLCHKSQKNSKHAGRTDGIYDPSLFGLAYTSVGPDTPGVNDMFENISQ